MLSLVTKRAGREVSESRHPLLFVWHPRVVQVDAPDFAHELYEYGGGRLEPRSLHVWMLQRMMLDAGFEHDAAARITDVVLDEERTRDEARAPRLPARVRLTPTLLARPR
jgi:hypothetical protein